MVKEILNKNNFNFKKKFGQNFLIDSNILEKIVSSADIDKNSLVIEIGPGAGALTKRISKKAKHVLAYEIDDKLKPILDEILSEEENIEIIYEDFLKRDIFNDIEKYEYKKLFVVANLPYYITTPIIQRIIDSKIPLNSIVIMVQKEVGNRFKAQPGSKEYNSLSIYLKYHFNIKKVVDVSRNVFIPKPNVDSIVIKLDKINPPVKLLNEKAFFQLVRDSFVFKRKTLRNNLKEYDLNLVEKVLNKYNLDLSVRAEKMDIKIFADIANNLEESKD